MATGLKIAIVGGGLAGLAAAMKIAEGGHEVDLISVVPVKRSHSVCAQGGINGAVNTKGEGDSPAKHLDDTVYGGDFLANQPPVKRMCDMAPAIINLFDRMGVPFSRTKEGLMDFRRFGGTLHHRTAFSGASTIIDSDVVSNDATDAASTSPVRVTLVGSIIPASTKSR